MEQSSILLGLGDGVVREVMLGHGASSLLRLGGVWRGDGGLKV